MKKAIVLTYAPISKEEEKLLKNTDIFKIACNWHAENLKPNKRLIVDKKIIDKVKAVGKQNIVTLNEYYDDERLEDYRHLPRRNSTLPSCVDYLVEHDFTDVLLVANNLVTNGQEISINFQNNNRKLINQLTNVIDIYKYSENGVFDVPHLSIKEFLNMREKLTPEEKLLGYKEPKKKTLLELCAFTDSYLYEVKTKGLDNASEETGEIVDGILPLEKKKEILEGAIEIEYNGLIIKRLTGNK